jgi:osmotically-inducible protein OsmY
MKKIFIGLTLITLLTTACVPAVLLGAGTATGAAIGRDSRSLQTMSDDLTIEFQANKKFQDMTAKGDSVNISVYAFNHNLLLTGQVSTESLQTQAEKEAHSIPQVGRVYNYIKVAPIEGMIQTADDTRIAANVKTRMAVASELNSNNFKIAVSEKVVFIMGLASRSQEELAVDVVSHSSGVKRVVNLVELQQNDDNTPSPHAKTPEAQTAATPTTSNTSVVGTDPEPLKMIPVSSSATAQGK